MITNNELQKKFYDKDFRKKLIANPEKHLTELGYKLHSGVKVKVVKSSKNIFYLSVNNMDNIDVSEIQAASELGIGTGTVGSLGSIATISSQTATISSLSSAGTLGTASSVDT